MLAIATEETRLRADPLIGPILLHYKLYMAGDVIANERAINNPAEHQGFYDALYAVKTNLRALQEKKWSLRSDIEDEEYFVAHPDA